MNIGINLLLVGIWSYMSIYWILLSTRMSVTMVMLSFRGKRTIAKLSDVKTAYRYHRRKKVVMYTFEVNGRQYDYWTRIEGLFDGNDDGKSLNLLYLPSDPNIAMRFAHTAYNLIHVFIYVAMGLLLLGILALWLLVLAQLLFTAWLFVIAAHFFFPQLLKLEVMPDPYIKAVTSKRKRKRKAGLF